MNISKSKTEIIRRNVGKKYHLMISIYIQCRFSCSQDDSWNFVKNITVINNINDNVGKKMFHNFNHAVHDITWLNFS